MHPKTLTAFIWGFALIAILIGLSQLGVIGVARIGTLTNGILLLVFGVACFIETIIEDKVKGVEKLKDLNILIPAVISVLAIVLALPMIAGMTLTQELSGLVSLMYILSGIVILIEYYK